MWSNIWKIKAPAKIKHFFWKSLSGALAVKEQLQTRGSPIDPTCQSCRARVESICHVLFLCDKARHNNITSLLWAVECMHNMRHNNIIFETSTEDTIEITSYPLLVPSLGYTTSQIVALLQKIEWWRLDHAAYERNGAANRIAESVTTSQWYQSYIAAQGPA